MRKLLKSMKTLLVAAGLLMGMNAWAETVGEANFSTGYLGATSTIKTMTSGGSLHYVFTVSKPTTKNWQNWILYVGATGETVSWANGLAIVRGDNWEEKWAKSSTENGSDAGCWNDFVWGEWDSTTECHPDFCEFMNGATVDMTVTYECGKLIMVATVTKDATTKNYTFYKFLDGAPESVDACLTVNGASLDITTADYTPAEPYYNVTRYLQDFADENTVNNGWTYGNNTTGSQTYIGGKALYISVSNSGGGRAANLNLSGQSASFASVSDYCFEFDFNSAYATDGAHETTTTLVSSEGTVFYMKNKNSTTTTIYNASDAVIGSFTNSGYNTKPTTTYHFIVKSSSTGTTLTVTQNGRNVMAETAVNAGLVHLTALNNFLGRAYNHAIFDNIMLRDHSAVEIVTDPTVEITGVSGANREVTITGGTSSKGNDVTTYYTIDGSNPTSASTAYSAPITIESNCTVKAISISSADGESGIVSLAVTTGAVTLASPSVALSSYESADEKYLISPTIIINEPNNSSVLLTPATEKLEYTFTPEGGTESARTAISSGATYTPTAKGTLKVYASSTGYTESSYSIPVSKFYSVKTKLDYAGLYTEKQEGWNDSDNDWGDYTVYRVNTENWTNSGLTYNRLNIRNNNTLDYVVGFGFGRYGSAYGYFRIRNQVKGNFFNVIKSTVAVEPVITNSVIFCTAGSGDASDAASVPSVAADNVIKTIYEYEPVSSVTANISAAGAATFVSGDALDFSPVTDLEAYIATAQDGANVTFDKVTGAVPAGTPLYLRGTTADVPVVTSADPVGTNLLVAGTGAAVASEADGKYNFILNKVGDVVGFYKAAGNTVASNRAYLSLSSNPFAGGAKSVNMIFGGETTGINTVAAQSNETGVKGIYNMQGQRVSNPTKGLYIVDGKKVAIP